MSERTDEFRRQIRELTDTVRGWMQLPEWAMREYQKKFRDETKAIFEAPALMLQKGPAKILLDPIAYDVPGYDAVVDLYLMPDYDDMAALALKDGVWEIEYPASDDNDKAGRIPAKLDRDVFLHVLNDIADNAVPSF